MAVIDTKYRQRTRALKRKLRRGGVSIARHSAAFLTWKAAHRLPRGFQPHMVPRTFFGVNCAPNPDAAWDAAHLRWIQELGVGSVRVDVSYDSDVEAFWRWVEMLHGAGLDVVAHLVQPAAAAANMHNRRERLDWEQFVTAILEPVRAMVSHAELGSTPNRRTWSGYSIADYAAAHEIARPILDGYGIRAVGPNVSDFAPYFSAGLLGELRRRSVSPHVHSDNLFVDRAAVPPEQPDHRAVGRVLSPVARLTLVNKLRWLDSLSQWAGCGETWVTCFAWTLARGNEAKPRYVTEEEQAALLMRYFILAAASGLAQRVFWSQLTGRLRGLINDGHPHRLDPPDDVFLRRANHALPEKGAKRKSFEALAQLTRLLGGSEFKSHEESSGEHRSVFTNGAREVVATWRGGTREAPRLQITEKEN